MPRLLGVTASRHGEGTTTTAAVFASILVRRRGGRVAVVEANRRSPSFDGVFAIPRDGGFAELIEGKKTLVEVALPTEVANLFALGCGHSELGAPALFDSPGVAAALEELRKQFEFVIFDLPPANVYADTSILAPRLDAALIVIEADGAKVFPIGLTLPPPPDGQLLRSPDGTVDPDPQVQERLRQGGSAIWNVAYHALWHLDYDIGGGFMSRSEVRKR